MSKPKADLTIIILSYNVKELLLDCLASLKKSETPSDRWEIMMIDNSSSDDSVSAVKSKYPEIKLILNNTNTGFAHANNQALKQVTTDYVLLLNPDTVVYPGTIQTVLQYIKEHPGVGAATCRVELPDGTLDYSSHRRFPNPWNSFVYFFTGLGKKSSYAYSDIPSGIHEIDALTGAFALFRTRAGREVNWFDEDYFWNGEDLDLCFRMKEKGWKIMFLPDVKITHIKGASSGLHKNTGSSVNRSAKIKAASAGVNAMRIFYNKHYAPKYPAPFNWFIYSGMWVLRTYRILKITLGRGI